MIRCNAIFCTNCAVLAPHKTRSDMRPLHKIKLQRQIFLACTMPVSVLGVIAGAPLASAALFALSNIMWILLAEARFRRGLRGAKFLICPKCAYDLRATQAIGAKRCPECGGPSEAAGLLREWSGLYGALPNSWWMGRMAPNPSQHLDQILRDARERLSQDHNSYP